MNVDDPLMPGGGDRPPLSALILAVVAAVLAAQSEAWASALATAATVYTVLAGGNQNRRS